MRSRLKRINREYKRKAKNSRVNTCVGAFLLGLIAGIIVTVTIMRGKTEVPAEVKVQEVEAQEVIPTPAPVSTESIDELVGKYVDEFFTTRSQRSEVRMIMHCLLNRESKHSEDTGRGDGGKAIGILQFHQPTWNGYRKIMIDRGFAIEIGSPLNVDQAIRTTVWAIKDGRAYAWGPILRWSKGRYSEAACPVPSFY